MYCKSILFTNLYLNVFLYLSCYAYVLQVALFSSTFFNLYNRGFVSLLPLTQDELIKSLSLLLLLGLAFSSLDLLGDDGLGLALDDLHAFAIFLLGEREAKLIHLLKKLVVRGFLKFSRGLLLVFGNLVFGNLIRLEVSLASILIELVDDEVVLDLLLRLSLRNVLECLVSHSLQLSIVRGYLIAGVQLLLNTHDMSLEFDLLFSLILNVLVLNDGLDYVAEVLHVEG